MTDKNELTLDALAEIIRIFGKHAFPIKHNFDKDATEAFEAWATHLLMGTEHPERSDKKGFSFEERDWHGVVQYFQKYREAEKTYVEKAVGEQKDVIWSFVKQLGQMAQEDTESNKEIVSQLDNLLKASKSGDMESMKEETQNSVALIVGTFKNREERNKKMLEGINSKVKNLEVELETTKQEASTDPLTGVYTRGTFDVKLKQTVAQYKRSGQPAALFFFDVDQFKQVNDTYGHQVGDEVLKKIARAVIGVLMRETDTVARYGGDEFAAIMANVTRKDAESAGQKIVEVVAALKFDNPEVATSVSVGMAFVEKSDDGSSWLKRADSAVYKAKESGRNNLKIAS